MTGKVVPQYRARRRGERARNEEVNAELNKAIPARVGVESNKGDFKISANTSSVRLSFHIST